MTYSNTSLERHTDEDGLVSHRHRCCVCFREWWDLSSYGKWCSDSCFFAEDGHPDE